MFGRKPPAGPLLAQVLRRRVARACRIALRRRCAQALGVSGAAVRRRRDCAQANREEASCSDETRSTSASGVSIPAFPYLNRPTFQQTVELTRKLGH